MASCADETHVLELGDRRVEVFSDLVFEFFRVLEAFIQTCFLVDRFEHVIHGD